jgi:ribosomal-protein-alanine N-acetyltransferase
VATRRPLGLAWVSRSSKVNRALLAEQEAGRSAFYVLVGEAGAILGRFNLYDIEAGVAELGYRVAQDVAGRGVATAAVRELCRLAAAEHGLHTLRAGTSLGNAASARVLAKAGFVPVGAADPVHLGGKDGIWFQRDLVQPFRTCGTDAGQHGAAHPNSPLDETCRDPRGNPGPPSWRPGFPRVSGSGPGV